MRRNRNLRTASNIGTWNRQISTITGPKYSLQNCYIDTYNIGLYFVHDIVMQDVHVQLNPGSLLQKRRSARRFFFSPANQT